MTYVENEDDPARIWTILHDRFCATNDVTLCQAVTYIVTLCMADEGDMEAHIRDFTAGKRRVEEHSVTLVYRTFFMLYMPATYQMTVTAIESQAGVTLEVAQNRLLEEWRKRKGPVYSQDHRSNSEAVIRYDRCPKSTENRQFRCQTNRL